MPPEADNKPKAGMTAASPQAGMDGEGTGATHATANRIVEAGALGAEPATVGTGALVVRSEDELGQLPPEELDTRLDRLPMRLDGIVNVHSFRVQDLLSMEKGTIVETVHEHTQDVPVCCGGALLAWAEFEVLDQRLAVRITRLA
jgi:flagellar motor switch protein FliN/FliY